MCVTIKRSEFISIALNQTRDKLSEKVSSEKVTLLPLHTRARGKGSPFFYISMWLCVSVGSGRARWLSPRTPRRQLPSVLICVATANGAARRLLPPPLAPPPPRAARPPQRPPHTCTQHSTEAEWINRKMRHTCRQSDLCFCHTSHGSPIVDISICSSSTNSKFWRCFVFWFC